jgi:hypothetical protein
MKYFLYIAYFLLAPSSAVLVGCFQNVTFSGISSNVWLNNTIDCHSCTCYMLTTNSVAVNCYNNGINNTHCLIFNNYSSATGGVQLVAGQNGSSACFVQFPPESMNQSSSYCVFVLFESNFQTYNWRCVGPNFFSLGSDNFFSRGSNPDPAHLCT